MPLRKTQVEHGESNEKFSISAAFMCLIRACLKSPVFIWSFCLIYVLWFTGFLLELVTHPSPAFVLLLYQTCWFQHNACNLSNHVAISELRGYCARTKMAEFMPLVMNIQVSSSSKISTNQSHHNAGFRFSKAVGISLMNSPRNLNFCFWQLPGGTFCYLASSFFVCFPNLLEHLH